VIATKLSTAVPVVGISTVGEQLQGTTKMLTHWSLRSINGLLDRVKLLCFRDSRHLTSDEPISGHFFLEQLITGFRECILKVTKRRLLVVIRHEFDEVIDFVP
jgi:hypothetical protein